jgi:hypothetical protein
VLRTWDVFYPDILPHVQGCPEPTVDREILATVRDLCEFTKVWRQDLDPIVTVETVATYPLVLPLRSELVQAEEAAINGIEVRLGNAQSTSLADRLAGNGGIRIQLIDSTQLRVLPTPMSSGDEIVLASVLKPSDDATGVDSSIADSYKTIIAAGALSRLLMFNKAEWANPALGAVKATEYNAARGRLQWRVAKARSASAPRSRAQFF